MTDKKFKVKTGLDLPAPLPIDQGGTGQTTANNILNAILPPQTSASGKLLTTDGTSTSWIDKPIGYSRGSTASRPGSGQEGDLYYNTDEKFLQVYSGGLWHFYGIAPKDVTAISAVDQGSGRPYNDGKALVSYTLNPLGGVPKTTTIYSFPGSSSSLATSSPVVVTGLTSGTSTQFYASLTSILSAGTYGEQLWSNPITITTVPQAPSSVSGTSANNQSAVSFVAGATGGATVTQYTVTSSPGGITATGASSPITVTGLTNGTSYTFTVTATNANGTSLASAASSAVVPNIPTSPIVGSYDSIATVIVPSGGVSSITFSGIPSGYRQLQLRHLARATSTAYVNGGSIYMQFNGDASSSYSFHDLRGDGSNASAYGQSSSGNNVLYINGATGSGSSNTFIYGAGVTDIIDYSNPSKNTTIRVIGGQDINGAGIIDLDSGSWYSTAPVTSIQITGGPFAQYSSFALFGVK